MAWCHQATSHYLSQCWPRSVSPYGVTRPQWVNAWCLMTSQHWFRKWLDALRQQAITWANVDEVPWPTRIKIDIQDAFLSLCTHIYGALVVMGLIEEDGVSHGGHQGTGRGLDEGTHRLAAETMDQTSQLMRVTGCQTLWRNDQRNSWSGTNKLK